MIKYIPFADLTEKEQARALTTFSKCAGSADEVRRGLFRRTLRRGKTSISMLAGRSAI